METNKEPKYLKDFFIYNKRYHWFIIPTIVFYYRKDTFFAGFQIQKNIYYNGK